MTAPISRRNGRARGRIGGTIGDQRSVGSDRVGLTSQAYSGTVDAVGKLAGTVESDDETLADARELLRCGNRAESPTVTDEEDAAHWIVPRRLWTSSRYRATRSLLVETQVKSKQPAEGRKGRKTAKPREASSSIQEILPPKSMATRFVNRPALIRSARQGKPIPLLYGDFDELSDAAPEGFDELSEIDSDAADVLDEAAALRVIKKAINRIRPDAEVATDSDNDD